MIAEAINVILVEEHHGIRGTTATESASTASPLSPFHLRHFFFVLVLDSFLSLPLPRSSSLDMAIRKVICSGILYRTAVPGARSMSSWWRGVEPAPKDPILGVTEAFLADPCPDKVNVGVVSDQNAPFVFFPFSPCINFSIFSTRDLSSDSRTNFVADDLGIGEMVTISLFSFFFFSWKVKILRIG